ncbi:MAG: rod shape-determining protein RodA [Candidatus Andersenbacteria bacterium]
MFRALQRYGWLTIGATAALVLLGIAFIYSASLSLDNQRQLLVVQGAAAVVGVAALILNARLDYRTYRSWARTLYVVTLVALVAVLILGQEVRGTHAWFDIGPIRLQPSEFAKAALVVALAKYFSDHRTELYRFKHFVISFLYVLIPVGLILIEPDLGTAIILVALWAGYALTVGMRRWHLLVFTVAFALTALVGWKFVLKDYQKERITTFLRPIENCQTIAAYNVCQSYIAIGSGGVTGRGFGQGTQSQLNFLPEKHTDFIFAVIAEELGFVGVTVTLGIIGLLVYAIFRTSQQAADNFGLFVALGVGLLILIQTVVNLGANLGVLPVTGVTLPLVSYGGSSLVATLAMLGLVLSVRARHKKQTFA